MTKFDCIRFHRRCKGCLFRLGLCEDERDTFVFLKEHFAFYSTALDKWVVENGDYEIMVGASSQDIRLQKDINI